MTVKEQYKKSLKFMCKIFSDEMVDKWLLMNSPYPLLNIFAMYLIIVKYAGPKFMQNRKPFNLNNFTRIYNLYQVICCIYIVSLSPAFLGTLNPYKCYSGRVENPFHLKVGWFTLILRTSEFFETIVFVLRKKQNQVSWLHIYHHIAVVSLYWAFFKYSAPGNEFIIIGINSAVHVAMYSYYFLSSFNGFKSITNKVKSSITTMQIIQLVIIMTHIIHALARCNVTKLYWLQLGNIVILIAMFMQFYFSTYRKEKVRNV